MKDVNLRRSPPFRVEVRADAGLPDSPSSSSASVNELIRTMHQIRVSDNLRDTSSCPDEETCPKSGSPGKGEKGVIKKSSLQPEIINFSAIEAEDPKSAVNAVRRNVPESTDAVRRRLAVRIMLE